MDNLTFAAADLPGVRMLSRKTVSPAAELGEKLGRLYGVMYGLVGARITGPPVCVYPEPFDPENVVAVAGVPFDGEPPYGFDIMVLPACHAIVGSFVGPYEGLPEAWRETFAYVAAQGLEAGGAPYERYRVGVGDAEPEQYETDIVVPVR
jgi:effector-binding domain-containing protein